MKQYLMEHLQRYPEMQIEDVVKLLYQSEYGGGHMIEDAEKSLNWIREEYAQQRQHLPAGPRMEPIGGGLCRMYLGVLDEGLRAESLNQWFVKTANEHQGSREGMEDKLRLVNSLCMEGVMPFSFEQWKDYVEAYRQKGCPAISHSKRYREIYAPSYRVVSERYAEYYPAFLEIDRALMQGEHQILVAIDGRCGSGKTTLGECLREMYSCNLFHTDDYFLRPEQRNTERLAKPGGNVDYERFQKEILEHITDKDGLTYQIFDCSKMQLGEQRTVPYSRLNIVEGVYSQHPFFGEPYQLKFFYDIDPEEQLKRIEKRNGPVMLERFRKEWIPLEETYFDTYRIKDNSIVIL